MKPLKQDTWIYLTGEGRRDGFYGTFAELLDEPHVGLVLQDHEEGLLSFFDTDEVLYAYREVQEGKFVYVKDFKSDMPICEPAGSL
jgi:hypothetical protein